MNRFDLRPALSALTIALLATTTAISAQAAGTAPLADAARAPVPTQRHAPRVAAIVAASVVAASVVAASVVAVLDGDTVIAIVAGKGQISVRVAGIDAPESAQRHGRASREHLAALVCGRSATLAGDKVDPFARLVATVEVDGVDVGLEQIRAGLAWHFTRYAHEQQAAQRLAYAQAEAKAREHETGLWRDPAPEPPWSFRERHRRARETRETRGPRATPETPETRARDPRAPQPAAPRVPRSRDMC